MNFASNENLIYFLLIPLLLFLFILGLKRRGRFLDLLVSPQIRESPELQKIKSRKIINVVLGLVAVAMIVLALLRPQWGYTVREGKRMGVDIFVLVDTSLSMQAEDISPSRLERARRELIDLIELLQGDRIGLIPFSGKAYVACPLTTDYQAFRLFIDQLSTDLIPIPGTNLVEAFGLAERSFGEEANRSRAIILLTDGEETEADFEEKLAPLKGKMKIFVIGMGTNEGAPIPDPLGGFKKDQQGELVLSKLNENFLKKIALATGGVYVRSITGDKDLEEIYLSGIRTSLEGQEINSGSQRIPHERYQIPLALGIVLLMIQGRLRED